MIFKKKKKDDDKKDDNKSTEVRVVVGGLAQMPNFSFAVVIGEEKKDDPRHFTIYIDHITGMGIAEGLKVVPPAARPLTHQLMEESWRATYIKPQKVVIDDLKDNTYYASIYLHSASAGYITLDSRPSDAIAMAIRFNIPIYANEEVLEKAMEQQEENPDEQDIETKEIAPDLDDFEEDDGLNGKK
jgi:bifunctional DNase/RNase